MGTPTTSLLWQGIGKADTSVSLSAFVQGSFHTGGANPTRNVPCPFQGHPRKARGNPACSQQLLQGCPQCLFTVRASEREEPGTPPPLHSPELSTFRQDGPLCPVTVVLTGSQISGGLGWGRDSALLPSSQVVSVLRVLAPTRRTTALVLGFREPPGGLGSREHSLSLLGRRPSRG